MLKLDKLLSFAVLVSLLGVIVAPIAGIVSGQGPDATMFMYGLIAMAGFMIALVLALGVIVSITQARPPQERQA